jgi:DNA-binding transcriptional LysR family regulator
MNYKHPLAKKENIHISDLAREPFIMREREESPQWFDYTLMLCAKNGFSPNIVSQSRRVETVLMMVDAGIGITIMPDYLQMYNSPSLRMVKIEGEKETLDVVVYRKKTNMNPSIPLFLDELDSVLSEYDSAAEELAKGKTN